MPGARRRKRTPGGIQSTVQQSAPRAADTSAVSQTSELGDARERPTSRPPRPSSFEVVPNLRARLDDT